MSIAKTSAVQPHSSAPAMSSDPGEPSPLRERAFTLYCQGLRSPAIAATLGVPERTIRSWITATLDTLAGDAQDERRRQLLVAIEQQRTLAAAAWQGYERAAALESLALASAVPATTPPAVAAPDTTSPSPAVANPAESQRAQGVRSGGARYLAIAFAAQREIARLQHLYDQSVEPPQPVHILITHRPASPDALPPELKAAWEDFAIAYLTNEAGKRPEPSEREHDDSNSAEAAASATPDSAVRDEPEPPTPTPPAVPLPAHGECDCPGAESRADAPSQDVRCENAAKTAMSSPDHPHAAQSHASYQNTSPPLVVLPDGRTRPFSSALWRARPARTSNTSGTTTSPYLTRRSII